MSIAPTARSETPPVCGTAAAWTFVVVLTACYTLSVIDRYVFAYLVVDIQRDLGLSDLSLGLLQGFAFSIFYAVTGVPLGLAVDRLNRKRLVAGAVALWSAMTVLCGAARGFASLAGARMGVGVGEAVLSPAVYSTLPDLFDRRRLPLAMAVYSLGAVWASACAAALSGWILTLSGDARTLVLPLLGEQAAWRVVFFAAGAPGFLFAGLVLMLKEPPRRKEGAAGEAGQAAQDRLAPFLSRHWRTHGVFCLAMTLTTLMSYALNAWTPSVFTRTYGWTPAQIGAVMGVVTATGGVIGCLLGGGLTTWVVRTGRIAAVLWIALGAVVFMLLFGALTPFTTNAGQFTVLLAGAFVASPLMLMVGPTLLQMITPPRLRGRMSAVFLLANIGVGAGAGPALVGAFSTYVFKADTQLNAALGTTIAVAALIAAVLLLSLLRPMRRFVEDHDAAGQGA